jgi:23S rRNA pseudouridine1911/1915/1917 synthase
MDTVVKLNPDFSMSNPVVDEVFEDIDELDTVLPESSTISLKLGPESCGVRLDKVLSGLLPQYSRGRLQQWIEEGLVTVDGAPAKVRATVYGDETILVQPQMSQSEQPYLPEPVALDVVYEDADLIVINKVAGLVVHPGAGNWTGTLLNGLLHRWPELAGIPRAGIVHRLDKDTSGLMVIAKTLLAQTDLVRQLQDRSVQREYLALVWGQPVSNGRIEAAIGRHPRERVKMAVSTSPQAKPAITHYQKLGMGMLDGRPVALLLCKLETGRTHQIRVHMQSIGFPLVGDGVYGKQHLVSVFPRQALHAQRLGLLHPVSDLECAWVAPVPEDMHGLLLRAGIALPE